MKKIDAGHGGGQVFRTALSLAALTGQAVEINNIRKNRPKTGLQAQHKTCADAAAAITCGTVEHNAIGSDRVVFVPGPVKRGRYEFDIGTAGSCSLLLQCILPPLLLADGPSAVRIIGGTDVPFSPPFLFLERAFVPALTKMGASVHVTAVRHGFYPQGGGILDAIVQPAQRLIALDLPMRPKRGSLQAIIQSAQLPNHVAEREKAELTRRLGPMDVRTESVPAANAGNVVSLHADYGGFTAGFDALGKIGKSAEAVATDAAEAFERFDAGSDALEPHLLDQLLPYAALAPGLSRIKVAALTEHAESNLRVIHELLSTRHEFDHGILTVYGKPPDSHGRKTTP